MLPEDAQARKEIPVYSGLIKYFPLALIEVAKLSWHANEQHNPGEPLHWSRHKSNDHADCSMRHLFQMGTLDDDGQRHTTKLAWRALAMLELELEKILDNGTPEQQAELKALQERFNMVNNDA